ncbi:MAG: DUF6599 family protein [Candidatus Eisenbacteria bacterium]
MSKAKHIAFHPVIVWMLLAVIMGCGADRGAYTHLFPLPGDIDGVRARGEIAEYRDSTLYDFLNGGAEMYFDYGIVAAAAGEYATESGSEIEMSVYDMGTAGGAFGIYSTVRYAGADFVDIGSEAMKTASSLDFWKGRYYCRLLAFETAPESEAAMLTLGKALAANIAEAGDLPAIIDLLPAQSRVERSEKYFLKPLALNNIRYIDPENVLHLGDDTEGVVAGYETGEIEATGFIISYPTAQAAAGAYESYLVHLDGQGTLERRDGSAEVVFESGMRTFVAVHKTYILGVWDAESPETGYAFVKNVLARIEKTLSLGKG